MERQVMGTRRHDGRWLSQTRGPVICLPGRQENGPFSTSKKRHTGNRAREEEQEVTHRLGVCHDSIAPRFQLLTRMRFFFQIILTELVNPRAPTMASESPFKGGFLLVPLRSCCCERACLHAQLALRHLLLWTQRAHHRPHPLTRLRERKQNQG